MKQIAELQRSLKLGFVARGLRIFAVMAAVLALPALTQAAPVTWTLQNATFSDGGVATGSFVYNPDTGAMTTWNISVSGGDTANFSPFSYTPNTASFTILAGTMIFSGPIVPSINPASNGFRQLRFEFANPLSDAGGTDGFSQAGLGSVECYNCNPFRLLTSGDVFAPPPSATPEPASLLLYGTGLLGLLFLIMKRRSAAAGC